MLAGQLPEAMLPVASVSKLPRLLGWTPKGPSLAEAVERGK
jgi:hypothetical protein